ncbi:MAG TPA: LysR substrate-binding domain-containing protein [Burkholderiaceae bacterium]|nr:LysR substrate-binding domain-containing protein [Burkholderiaceae bacterium]
MQAFRRVVELHSFNAAARSLEMSGGAISKLVAQLEEDVGARLLNRTTRTVSVSEEGAAFYEAAVRILEEVEIASEQARSQSSVAQGRLKVAVPTSFALMWLSSRVPEFLARFPQVTLELALNDRFADLVQEGFDCALRITTQMPDSQLVARPLGTVERVIVAARSYLKNAPPLEKPEDLKAHDCLLYTQTASPNEWPLTGTAQGRPVEVRGSYRVNNSVMLRDALVAGQGVTLTPRFVVDDLLRSGALTEVLSAYRPQNHTLFGVVAHQRHVARKVRVFLDFIEEKMTGAR